MTNQTSKVPPSVGAQISNAPHLAPELPSAVTPTGPVICFVIDDEPGVQNIIAEAATPLGVRVERFRSAEKALKAMEKVKPTLLFLDVSLEGSDAIDVIRGLTKSGFAGTIQLISGRDAQTMEEVRRVGERHSFAMLPPMRKPFRLEAVRSVVRQHLEGPLQKSGPASAKATPEVSIGRVDLDAMLRKNWLELWYQPKIDLKKMSIVGAEGLVRCRHPEKGILLPESFLPSADDGWLIRLTEFVLRTALADWTRFAQIGFPFRLALNAPVVALEKLPILALVRENKPKNENWPGIILEVTEDQVVRDIPRIHEIATQLRIHDILLAIDDFGVGYSHLARLKELPFAELKIADSLVLNCGKDANNASVCQAAIELAHRFGSIAVAESIENISELKALCHMGCDLGQGFLFGKALPRDKLLSSLVDSAINRQAAF